MLETDEGPIEVVVYLLEKPIEVHAQCHPGV